MLAHLWVDTVFPDGSTARSLVPAMPDDLRSAFRELDTAGKRAGGLAAAAGSLPSGSTDLVRQTVLGVLLRGVGLPDQYPQAQFVLWLQEHGHLKTVKDEVTKAGKVWEAELNNLYVSGHIARGVLACDPKFAASEIEARKTIREQFPKRDTDITTADFLRVAKQALRLAGRDGRFPCTVLILDEAQQYIGDSNDRSVLVHRSCRGCLQGTRQPGRSRRRRPKCADGCASAAEAHGPVHDSRAALRHGRGDGDAEGSPAEEACRHSRSCATS